MREFIGIMVLIAVVAMIWKWVLAAVVLVLVAKAAHAAWRELQAERADRDRERAALIARADQQDQWVVRGDPRGTFGEGYVGLNS